MARDSMKTGVFGDGVIKLAVPWSDNCACTP